MTAKIYLLNTYATSHRHDVGFPAWPGPTHTLDPNGGIDMVSKNLLTSPEVLELIEQLTGDTIKPDTFRSYANRGQAPAPKERVGRTLLWSKREIEEWASNRPGRGARTDLTRREKPRRRKTDSDTASE